MKKKLVGIVVTILIACSVILFVKVKEYREISVFKRALRQVSYVKGEFGDGYLDNTIYYDLKENRAYIPVEETKGDPAFRNGSELQRFRGRYLGVDVFEDFLYYSSNLSYEQCVDFISFLQLNKEELENQNYQVVINDEEHLEYFIDILNSDSAEYEFREKDRLKQVEITFDEKCRVTKIQYEFAELEGFDQSELEGFNAKLYKMFSYDVDKREFVKGYMEVQDYIDKTQYKGDLSKIDLIKYLPDFRNLSKSNTENGKIMLAKQIQELKDIGQWDREAIIGYMELLDTKIGYRTDKMAEDEFLNFLSEHYDEVQKVGSLEYLYLFNSSNYNAKSKALLVIKQMGGYIDEFDMLKFDNGYVFDPKMPPQGEFLETYAECVREAYMNEDGEYKNLDSKEIHQFRMYIDKNNINYIRENYEGNTDFEKLKQYEVSEGVDLYYGEKSRHHNKIQKGIKEFNEQSNDKVLTDNKLSEFIVNVETGGFVTQWDLLQYDENKTIISNYNQYQDFEELQKQVVLDTESFNYAPADNHKGHKLLDILPASPIKKKLNHYYLEYGVKRLFKEGWASPKLELYNEIYNSEEDYEEEIK